MKILQNLEMHLSTSLLLIYSSAGATAGISYLDTPIAQGAFRVSPDGASSARRTRDYDWPQLLDCPNNCPDEEFCGKDFKCHRYSCENWYSLAPANFTGYNSKISTQLECNVVAAGEEDITFLNIKPYCQGGDMPIAVNHRTDECVGGPACPSRIPGYNGHNFVQMNRKCTARPSPETVFVCYDISPDTDSDTYFADYATATAGQLNTVECGANKTDKDSHFYTGVFQAPHYTLLDGAGSSEAFDASLVQAAMIGSYAVIEESVFPFCNPGCRDTEFCGRDLMCHDFSCENMFLQGPKAYTGQADDESEDVPKTLTCFDTNPDDGVCGKTVSSDSTPVFPIALRYECSPENANIIYASDQTCPSPRFEGRFVSYNRYCTAKPNPDQVFSCYDIPSETDAQTHFQDYINALQANSNCTEDNLHHPIDSFDSSNRTRRLVGSHHYQTCLRNDTNVDYTVFNGYDMSLDTLDVERARFTMYVALSGKRAPLLESVEDIPDRDGAASTWQARSALLLTICVLLMLFVH